MNAAIWIAIAVLALIVLLFGITNTWGILAFIALIVLVIVAVVNMAKGHVKMQNNQVTVTSQPGQTIMTKTL